MPVLRDLENTLTTQPEPPLTADMQAVLDYARARGISAASLLEEPEWSGRNVRCSCGAVHYDMNPEAIWTCPECGLEHVPLTRDEGRQFMQALAGEYSPGDEPDPGCLPAVVAGRDPAGGAR